MSSAIYRLQFLKVCFKPPPLALRLRSPPPALVKHSSSAPGSTPFSLLKRRLSNTPKTKNVPPKEDTATAPAKLSLFQKFKAMYRDYWYVLMPVHVVTSVGWIGSFYYMIKSGVDIGYYMKKVGFSESLVNKADSGAGHLALAYALYKIATPVRYAVTLGGTTLAINSLRNLGYITPAREIIQKNKTRIQNYAKSKQSK